MRLFTVNISNLTNLRETLQFKRCIFHAFITSLLIGFWWFVIERSSDMGFYDFSLRVLISSIILIPVLVVILFRKNYFSRFIYFFILVFNLIGFFINQIALIILINSAKSNIDFYFFVTVLILLFLYDLIALKYVYRLFFSLVSFGRGKTLKHEISCCLRLSAGEWAKFENKDSKIRIDSEKMQPTWGVKYRMVLGIIAFVLGLICLFLTLVSGEDPNFSHSLYNLEFSRAWNIIRNFPVAEVYSSNDSWLSVVTTLIILFISFFWFSIFGFFQHQRRREQISVYKSFLSQHITSSDILLLRSFEDDVKYVGHQPNPLLLPFNSYPWDFTLEQLIVNRLKNFGKVHLLDKQEENEELLEYWFVRVFIKLFGEKKVKLFLELHCPMIWLRIPALGGIRYYTETDDSNNKRWKEEILKSMPIARMQIVILGMTKNLEWEMKKIRELNLFEKTIFLMPPLILKKNTNNRWDEFINYLNKAQNYDVESLRKIKPRRVLAVCMRENSLICISGKSNSALYYESALDISTILTASDEITSELIITRYVDE